MLRDFQMIGRLGRLDEIPLKTQGNRGCELRVACSDYKDGEETTSWFSVTCFGKTADTAIDMYNVGDLLFVSGIFDMETWKDKQTGKDRTKLKLKAFRCRRISKGKLSQESGGQSPTPAVYQKPQGGGYNQEFSPQGGAEKQQPQQQEKGNYYGNRNFE
mgnify:CR=1 FL=1